MKRKSILMFLLMALFLNISHDFIIFEESSDSCKSSIQITLKIMNDTCCSKSMELHETFHFVAILPDLALHYPSPMIRPTSEDRQLHSIKHQQHFIPPKA